MSEAKHEPDFEPYFPGSNATVAGVLIAPFVRVEFTAREAAAISNLLGALERIRDARDFKAEHGEYPDDPAGPIKPDQGFDDWAADVASAALAKATGATK